jgi:hypothetical protein
MILLKVEISGIEPLTCGCKPHALPTKLYPLSLLEQIDLS